MHELSIARNILEIVNEEINFRNIRSPVEKIVFRANRINAIFPDSLDFLFNSIKEEYPFLQDCSLDIILDPYQSVCLGCGKNFETDEIEAICNTCGGKLKLLEGKEMNVESFSTFE